jgi:hypothetical protein
MYAAPLADSIPKASSGLPADLSARPAPGSASSATSRRRGPHAHPIDVHSEGSTSPTSRRRRERRTAKKLVSFTPEELDAVAARALACGRTPARFIREASLGAVPKARRHETADALVRELARVGNSLNQLARAANVSDRGVDAARLAEALAALDAAIDRIG